MLLALLLPGAGAWARSRPRAWPRHRFRRASTARLRPGSRSGGWSTRTIWYTTSSGTIRCYTTGVRTATRKITSFRIRHCNKVNQIMLLHLRHSCVLCNLIFFQYVDDMIASYNLSKRDSHRPTISFDRRTDQNKNAELRKYHRPKIVIYLCINCQIRKCSNYINKLFILYFITLTYKYYNINIKLLNTIYCKYTFLTLSIPCRPIKINPFFCLLIRRCPTDLCENFVKIINVVISSGYLIDGNG